MIKRFILILASFFVCSFAISQEVIYKDIKQISYKAYYNWGIIWLNVGNAKIDVDSSQLYPNAISLSAYGTSKKSWDWMFKVRDTLISHTDKDSFKSYNFFRSAHEGDYHARFFSNFNYSDSTIICSKNRIGKYIKNDTIYMLENTHDMLSIAWKVRTLDFESFNIDESVPMNLFIDDKVHHLYFKYLGVHQTKVAGRKYDCYVFSPQVLKGKIFKGEDGMKIWVSKDENRIPILIEAKILVGSLKAIIDFKNCILN